MNCCHNSNENHDHQSPNQLPTKKNSTGRILVWLGVLGVALYLIWNVLSTPGIGAQLGKALSWLSFLACPIMMLFMMRGHGEHHGDGQDRCHQQAAEDTKKSD